MNPLWYVISSFVGAFVGGFLGACFGIIVTRRAKAIRNPFYTGVGDIHTTKNSPI